MNKNVSSWTLRWSVILGGLALAGWHTAGRHSTAVLAVQPLGGPVLHPPLVEPALAPAVPALAERAVHRSVTPSRATVLYNQKVRLHLFAAKSPKFLFIYSDDHLVVSGHRVDGPISISIDRSHVLVHQHHRVLAAAAMVTVTAGHREMRIKHAHANVLQTPGELLITVRKGRLHVVNILDLESYLLGIVEPELGSLRLPPEAIKAQLIAGRSYLLAVRDRHPHDDFDFCDSPHCQVYAGRPTGPAGRVPPAFMRAALQVRGVYLRYKGAPAAAFFHHSCGGCTEAIQDVWGGSPVPYLRRVKDSDGEALGSHGAAWTFTMSRSAFTKLARARHWIPGRQALEALRVIRTDLSGRATEILIESDQPKWVPARLFLQTLNRAYDREVLPSLMFHVTLSADAVRFEGHGWGHGVGMCQAGAVAMARQGKTYEQILQHYYPGTTLVRLPRTNARLPKTPSRWLRFLPWTED